MSWPALLLAAGYGTRLRPLSLFRAKAALPVAGRALIVRILERLREAGVARVVINLHHRAESVTALVGDGRRFDLDVRYSWEPSPLGSGGGPARALPLLAADRFFVINADTLADVDLAGLADAHVRTGALATLACAPADLARYNAILADGDGRFRGVLPRGAGASEIPPDVRTWHFVGVQAVSAAAFAGIPPDVVSETVKDIYPGLVAANPGAVRIEPTAGDFFDIGTPADYYETVRRIASQEGRDLGAGADCVVAASARVGRSILWDRVRIGERVELDACIVTDDVSVPDGARYARHVLTRDGIIPF